MTTCQRDARRILRSNRVASYGLGIAVWCVTQTGVLPSQEAGSRLGSTRSAAEDLRMFSQVLNQLRVNHPDSLDTHVLLMAAV